MTVREWSAMLLLGNGYVASPALRAGWEKLRYGGKVHDVMYSLERRGFAERATADYHATGTQWRLTANGAKVRDEVREMLRGLTRRKR
jgi:hypothetical protein